MRIIREKDLQVLWSWGDSERDHLERTFQQNLVDLLNTVRARQASSRPFSREELQELAEEVQQAGELLEQGMVNCFALAALFYIMAGGSAAEQRKRQELVDRFRRQVGKKVRVVHTSVAELKDRVLTLEAVHGFKGLLRDGEDRWETPLDRLAIVEEGASAAPAAESARPRVLKPTDAGGTPGPEKPVPAEASKPAGSKEPEKPPVVLRRRQVSVAPAGKPPAAAGPGGFGTETVSRVVPPPAVDLPREESKSKERKPAATKAGDAPPAPPTAQPQTPGANAKPKVKPRLRKADEPAEDATAVLHPPSRTEKARMLRKKKLLKYTPRLRKNAPDKDAEKGSGTAASDAVS